MSLVYTLVSSELSTYYANGTTDAALSDTSTGKNNSNVFTGLFGHRINHNECHR